MEDIISILNENSSVLILGAHQDDLEICCTGLIKQIQKNNGKINVVYTTNGAPKDNSYYPRYNIDNPTDYALLRKKESLKALSLLGLSSDNATFFNYMDQDLINHIIEARDNLIELISIHNPSILVSPAYEGGHPDHDVTRLIAEEAVELSKKEILFLEYSEYNNYENIEKFFKFIPNESLIFNIKLNEEEISLKRKIFECFPSQKKYIWDFLSSDINNEKFRIAIKEDFLKLPHERPLYYENINIKLKPGEVLEKINFFYKH